jgi:hypothetical protein
MGTIVQDECTNCTPQLLTTLVQIQDTIELSMNPMSSIRNVSMNNIMATTESFYYKFLCFFVGMVLNRVVLKWL